MDKPPEETVGEKEALKLADEPQEPPSDVSEESLYELKLMDQPSEESADEEKVQKTTDKPQEPMSDRAESSDKLKLLDEPPKETARDEAQKTEDKPQEPPSDCGGESLEKLKVMDQPSEETTRKKEAHKAVDKLQKPLSDCGDKSLDKLKLKDQPQEPISDRAESFDKLKLLDQPPKETARDEEAQKTEDKSHEETARKKEAHKTVDKLQKPLSGCGDKSLDKLKLKDQPQEPISDRAESFDKLKLLVQPPKETARDEEAQKTEDKSHEETARKKEAHKTMDKPQKPPSDCGEKSLDKLKLKDPSKETTCEKKAQKPKDKPQEPPSDCGRESFDKLKLLDQPPKETARNKEAQKTEDKPQKSPSASSGESLEKLKVMKSPKETMRTKEVQRTVDKPQEPPSDRGVKSLNKLKFVDQPSKETVLEEKAPKTKDKPQKAPIDCSDKLKLKPLVNLPKLDLGKISLNMKRKLHSNKNVKREETDNLKRIGPKSKTENLKCIDPKSKMISKKHPVKSAVKKSINSPRKESSKKTKAESPVSAPLSLEMLDKKDFVSGVCLVCSQKSKECTNIFQNSRKFDHIIQRFLPISVNKEQPKTVCKNCLSVLIAVQNLSLNATPQQQQSTPVKDDCEDISSDDDDYHYMDDPPAEEKSSDSEENQQSHPLVSVIPFSQLVSPSKLSAKSSSMPIDSTSKSLVTTSTMGTSDIEIVNSFSLLATERKSEIKPLQKKHEPKVVKLTGKPANDRPSRKIIPPAKFANFIESAKPKGKKLYISVETPSGSTKEKSITLPIKTGNKELFGSNVKKTIDLPVKAGNKNLSGSIKENSINLPATAGNKNLSGSTKVKLINLPDKAVNKNLSSSTKVRLVNLPDKAVSKNLSSSTNEKLINLPDKVVNKNLSGSTAEKSIKLPMKVGNENFSGSTKEKSTNLPIKTKLSGSNETESIDPLAEAGDENLSDSTKEKSIDLPIEMGDKKKVQYIYDRQSGVFTDESPEIEQPVAKRLRKKGSTKEAVGAFKTASERRERLKAYKETVLTFRRHISGMGLPESGSLEDSKVVLSDVEKEKELLVNAHDPANLVDISPVLVTNTASRDIQNLLHLTKECLRIKVLIPSDKDTAEKDNAAVTPVVGNKTLDTVESAGIAGGVSSAKVVIPDPHTFRKVIDTRVDVFSNSVKGHLIPVYFRVLNESYSSEKSKSTIFTTITKILTQRKKDSITALEAERFEQAPSIFKQMSDAYDPRKEEHTCAKCNKKFLSSEIISHIKFSHLPQCLQCKQVCHSTDVADRHQSTRHKTSVKKCAVCKKFYQHYVNQVVHCEHWFRCSFCSQGFLDHENYIKHEKKHFESDFLDFLYKLDPTMKDRLDFSTCQLEQMETRDLLLIDYFWDKENFPASSFMKSKDKIVCIKCLQIYDNVTIFKNHSCCGEDKCLQVNFGALKCCKCQRGFKSKGTFYRHYRDCVDHSFNVTRALQSNTVLVEIECALCAGHYYSMEMFNFHFDNCYAKNMFHCRFCHTKMSIYSKLQHVKKCESQFKKNKTHENVGSQPATIPDTANEPLSVEEVDDLIASTVSALEVGTTDVEPNPAAATSSSVKLEAKRKGMDALLDETLIDFVGTACSTPLAKKFQKIKAELAEGKPAVKEVVNPAIFDSFTEERETGCEVDYEGPKVSSGNSPVIDLDAIESNLAAVETLAASGVPEVPEMSDPFKDLPAVDSATEKSAASLNKVPETAGTDQTPSAKSGTKTVFPTLTTNYVKKHFSVKILTTSIDAAPGNGSSEKSKLAENLDPNSKELQNLVKESDKSAEIKDGTITDVLNVSYSVFFTEVNGNLLPHHFRLAPADLSEAMKEKASSVIRSLLIKERKKVFKATGTQAPKPLKKPQRSTTSEPLVLQVQETMRGVIWVVCVHCKETFQRKDLRQHILDTHMVQCLKCKVYLTSSDELLNHVSIVHDQPYSTCLKCCKKFPPEEDPSNCPCLFNCNLCEETHVNWLQYLDHQMEHFHQMAFEFATETHPDAVIIERLRNHWHTARDAKLIFTCCVCGKRHASEDDVIKCTHSYKCVTCKTTFNTYSLLITHGCSFRYTTTKIKKQVKENQIAQLKEEKFIHLCPICDGRFESPDMFSAHYLLCVETSENPITDYRATYWVKCPYCIRNFCSEEMFLRHHYDCRKANSFLCDSCKEFISNSDRENHLKDCTAEVLCDNCGVSFSNRTSFNFHFRQQRNGTVTCKTLITDDDGNPFDSEPDPEIVMKSIRDGTFDSKACTYCGKMFSDVKRTSRHIIESHLDKVKTCPVCKKRLSKSICTLLMHRKLHTTAELVAATRGEDFGSFKCAGCSRYFNSTYHKILHQIYYHQKEVVSCSFCLKEFLSKANLQSHQVTCTEENHALLTKERAPPVVVEKPARSWGCLTCGTHFDNYREYLAHKKTHPGQHTCEICHKKFLSKPIMRDHIKRVHFGTPSTCEICGMAFSCLKNMQLHQKNVHTERPPAICETCGKSFKTSKHLRVHMTLHTGEKPYACTHCDRTFRLKQNLNQHLHKHSEDTKPFKCTLCTASFTQFNNLHLHKRQVHPETHKYQCQKCNFGYNDLMYFTKHVQTCSTERKVKSRSKRHFNDGAPRKARVSVKMCPYCNEDVSSLRVHLLRRTDEKPYHCQTCPKKFSYLCGLKHHEAQHFNTKKFKCKFCDKGFLGLKQYSFHLQMKHNDLFPMHCAHCSKGYNENKFYYRHIQQCNEFIVKPRYNSNSKKLTPQCTICDKIFMKFNDLRIHAAMVHKSQSHKKYQCQICDSSYDSNALLMKHAKHHYKDRCSPGMFLCPNCQFQADDFKTILKHDCPYSTELKDFVSSPSVPSKRPSSSTYTEPAKRRKSSRNVKKPSRMLDFEDSDEEDFSDDDSDSDSETDAEVKLESIEEIEGYDDYNVDDILVQPSEAKPDPLQIDPESVIEETVADSSNFIYHCSFCKENFSTLSGLQNHLRQDHGFDLNNLEFQVI